MVEGLDMAQSGRLLPICRRHVIWRKSTDDEMWCIAGSAVIYCDLRTRIYPDLSASVSCILSGIGSVGTHQDTHDTIQVRFLI